MITVYYMTYGPERKYAYASASYMATHSWITDIIIVHTDRECPWLEQLPVIPKVSHFHRFCGGVGINNADGINEVDARNTGVILASLKPSEWIMQCDSDEIFLPSPDFNIEDITNRDAALFEMHHFTKIDGYRIEGLPAFDGLHDPHVRLWKKSLNLRHEPPGHRMAGCDNPTGHTHFDVVKLNYTKVQKELAHIHFRDLTCRKRHNILSLETQHWPIEWPEQILPLMEI